MFETSNQAHERLAASAPLPGKGDEQQNARRAGQHAQGGQRAGLPEASSAGAFHRANADQQEERFAVGSEAEEADRAERQEEQSAAGHALAELAFSQAIEPEEAAPGAEPGGEQRGQGEVPSQRPGEEADEQRVEREERAQPLIGIAELRDMQEEVAVEARPGSSAGSGPAAEIEGAGRARLVQQRARGPHIEPGEREVTRQRQRKDPRGKAAEQRPCARLAKAFEPGSVVLVARRGLEDRRVGRVGDLWR